MLKYEQRIQRLPDPCRLVKDGQKVPLHYLKWLFWWFDQGIKQCIVVSSAKRAMEMLTEAETNHMGAFVSGPVPCNNNQHGVIAVSCRGETEWIFKSKYYFDIKKAHDSVFGVNNPIQTVSGKEMPIKETLAGDNVEDTRLACLVEFPIFDKEDSKKIIGYSTTKYTYKCRVYHLKKEWVTVKVWHHNANDAELKNVRVVETFVTTERNLQFLAESLGRRQIEELYCEQAIEL